MIRILLIIPTILLLLSNCAPKPFSPPVLEPIHYEKTPYYNSTQQINNIPKPEKLKPIYVNLNNNEITILNSSQNATHVMLAPEEYAKVGAVVKLATSYKQIILNTDILINEYIDQINILKETVELERKKAQVYRELWIGAVNMYQQERYDHQMDNLRNDIISGILFIGNIALLLFAL